MRAVERKALGKYELLHELARGGMAVLYLARDTGIEGFEKVVAVKCMLPELAHRREYVDMFLDEARIAASLVHPNLPHVYELGRDGDTYFFAMEYLHGADVRRLVRTVAARRRELPLEHAITIALGLCAGLHHAHEKRLVHRDVSPKNVFVTYDGGVKLLDFGIVHAKDKRSETSTGAVKGTVQYLAPEQVLANEVDARTDVFSASILVWELSTGRSLYTGADYEIMNRIVERDAPRPSTIVADYPPALEAIVMKGLAREPAQRFATAAELHFALEDVARGLQLATSTLGLARFMREIYVEDVAAYEDAKERGRLATRALVEVSTAKRAVIAASDPQVTKATRRLDGPRPARHRWWIAAIAAAVALVGGGYALYATHADSGARHVESATRDLPIEHPPAPAPTIAPAPERPAPSSATREPATSPATREPVVGSPPMITRHRKRPAPRPPAPAPTKLAPTDPKPTPDPKPTTDKPLTNRDLDAVLPPHR